MKYSLHLRRVPFTISNLYLEVEEEEMSFTTWFVLREAIKDILSSCCHNRILASCTEFLSVNLFWRSSIVQNCICLFRVLSFQDRKFPLCLVFTVSKRRRWLFYFWNYWLFLENVRKVFPWCKHFIWFPLSSRLLFVSICQIF